MPKFTLEIDGLGGYGPKAIEVDTPEAAIAVYWDDLSADAIPSETGVYVGAGHIVFTPQQIIDIVARARGREPGCVFNLSNY